MTRHLTQAILDDQLVRLDAAALDLVSGGLPTDVRIDPIRGPVLPHPGHGGCFPQPVEPPLRPIDR